MARNRVTGVDRETTQPAEAYAAFPPAKRCSYVAGWVPQLSRPTHAK
jgi:hypothetical protein